MQLSTNNLSKLQYTYTELLQANVKHLFQFKHFSFIIFRYRAFGDIAFYLLSHGRYYITRSYFSKIPIFSIQQIYNTNALTSFFNLATILENK